MPTYDSNMASEFYVMSNLYRLGLSPFLTLGNRKEIDIVLYKNNDIVTIDVKGLKGTTNSPIGTRAKLEQLQNLENHYFVFVCYRNRFNNISFLPETYIVFVQRAIQLSVDWPGQNQVSINYSTLNQHRDEFLNKWEIFL
jgi:Holliday junction resolvase-like predicted endonuclease